MKTVAVIIARMGSSRLPGKVLMPLGGEPVLAWVVRAARATPGVDDVVVATTTEARDNAIVDWCAADIFPNVSVFRGSENDVLSRFVGAAVATRADLAIRITGDCPFVDPQVIGAVARLQKQTGCAYASNISPRTFADGLDCEAIRMDALLAADKEATRPIDRECVTTWIQRNRSRFPAEAVINPLPGLHTERWVLDTAADLEFCRAIANRWPWHKGPPSQLDILDILDRNPELRKLNSGHVMNERFYDALAEEPIYQRTYTRSQAQLEKSRKVIPLGAQTFSKSYLQFPQPSPLFVTHGQGGIVWDADGNEFVDLVSALLPNILGYRDPDVDVAIRRQISAGISFSLATELEAQLAETICRLIPCAEAVRFGKTGTDATTAAVRAARAFTGRDLVFSSGYHGWSDVFIGGDSMRSAGVPRPVAALTHTSQIDFELAKAHLRDGKYACVIVEPEDAGGLAEIRSVCDKSGTVLIFDEVITGFRFDLGGAQKLYGVTPDLACFGKAMANGMPMSAVVGRRDIMRKFEPPDNVFYSGTFFGEALSIAASIATIDKLERENVLDHIRDAGESLAALATLRIGEYGLQDAISLYGHPSLKRLRFQDHGNATADQIRTVFLREMISSGTLIINAHALCYAHTQNDVKRVLKSYDHALAEIKKVVDGDVSAPEANAGVALRTA